MRFSFTNVIEIWSRKNLLIRLEFSNRIENVFNDSKQNVHSSQIRTEVFMSKRIHWGFFIATTTTALLTGCIANEDQSCITDSDCIIGVEKCDRTLKICLPKADNPPTSGKVPLCTSISQCPDAINWECTSDGCIDKKCYNDNDCINRNGKDTRWYCSANKVCERGAEPPKPMLKFEVRLDPTLIDSLSSAWRAYLDLGLTKIANLIMLICEPDDPTCKDPIYRKNLTQDDGFNKGIQNNYGPVIELYSGLPIGEFKLMIIADSEYSATIGDDWQKRHPGFLDWDGIPFDTDLLLGKDVDGVRIPQSIDINIQNASTTDLGVVHLGYFFQHDLSPHPDGENGILAVGVATGLRFIDMNTYEMIPTTPNGKIYDFKPVTPEGDVEASEVCTIAGDGEKLVWVILCNGRAYPFDVKTQKQASSGYIQFDSPAPKMALAHNHNGKKYLFVQNYPGPEAGSLTENRYKGLWGAQVDPLLEGAEKDMPIIATTYIDTGNEKTSTVWNDDKFLENFGAYHLVAEKDMLFVQPYHTSKLKDKGCDEDHICVASYKIAENAILIRKPFSNGSPFIDAGARLNSITSDEGEVIACNVATKTMQPKIGLIRTDDKSWLFVPRCLDTKVYDISECVNAPDRQCNRDPMKTDLKNHEYGQMLGAFSLSPDQKTLWAVPNNKSPLMLHAYLRDQDKYVTHNRFAAFPIDITGSTPELASDWNNTNIDNFKGLVKGDPLSQFITPENDPGLDLTAFYMKQHVLDYYPSANGALSSLMFNGAKMVVGKNTLWLIGHADKLSKSSVGVFGDIAWYDLTAQRAILQPPKDASFYEIFSYAGGAEQKFGFKLHPIQEVVANGLAYFDLDKQPKIN